MKVVLIRVIIRKKVISNIILKSEMNQLF